MKHRTLDIFAPGEFRNWAFLYENRSLRLQNYRPIEVCMVRADLNVLKLFATCKFSECPRPFCHITEPVVILKILHMTTKTNVKLKEIILQLAFR